MLSAEENERLCRVGASTPCGQLMRRYWHPVAVASELDAVHAKAVRLLGEDLVLYKDAVGKYGLIDRYCPHRGNDLSVCSMPDERGLRCGYHGWCVDSTGNCVDRPYELRVNPNSKISIRTKGY